MSKYFYQLGQPDPPAGGEESAQQSRRLVLCEGSSLLRSDSKSDMG